MFERCVICGIEWSKHSEDLDCPERFEMSPPNVTLHSLAESLTDGPIVVMDHSLWRPNKPKPSA